MQIYNFNKVLELLKLPGQVSGAGRRKREGRLHAAGSSKKPTNNHHGKSFGNSNKNKLKFLFSLILDVVAFVVVYFTKGWREVEGEGDAEGDGEGTRHLVCLKRGNGGCKMGNMKFM